MSNKERGVSRILRPRRTIRPTRAIRSDPTFKNEPIMADVRLSPSSMKFKHFPLAAESLPSQNSGHFVAEDLSVSTRGYELAKDWGLDDKKIKSLLFSIPEMPIKMDTTAVCSRRQEREPPEAFRSPKPIIPLGHPIKVEKVREDGTLDFVGNVYPHISSTSSALHNMVMHLLQKENVQGGPAININNLVYFHDPQRTDGKLIRLSCPRLQMDWELFLILLAGVRLYEMDPAPFLVLENDNSFM